MSSNNVCQLKLTEVRFAANLSMLDCHWHWADLDIQARIAWPGKPGHFFPFVTGQWSVITPTHALPYMDICCIDIMLEMLSIGSEFSCSYLLFIPMTSTRVSPSSLLWGSLLVYHVGQ